MSRMSELDIQSKRDAAENQLWVWKQPKNQDDLLSRLADARDLNVPERERENLCGCAHTEIEGQRAQIAELGQELQRERDMHIADIIKLDDHVCLRIKALIAARDAAQAALREYGQHDSHCQAGVAFTTDGVTTGYAPCVCGLSAALAQTAGKGE